MKTSIAESRRKVKNWTNANWEKSGVDFAGICQNLVGLMDRHCSSDSREVQAVVRRHYEWLKQFWTPTRESYAGHSQFIVDSDLRQAYETHHPQLPEFAAAAMKVFAKNELA